MPEIIRNDAASVIATADQATAHNDQFLALAQQLSALCSGGTGLEGAAQNALMGFAERLNSSAARFHGMAQPRIDSMRDSAAAMIDVGDGSSNALNAIDVDFWTDAPADERTGSTIQTAPSQPQSVLETTTNCSQTKVREENNHFAADAASTNDPNLHTLPLVVVLPIGRAEIADRYRWKEITPTMTDRLKTVCAVISSNLKVKVEPVSLVHTGSWGLGFCALRFTIHVYDATFSELVELSTSLKANLGAVYRDLPPLRDDETDLPAPEIYLDLVGKSPNYTTE